MKDASIERHINSLRNLYNGRIEANHPCEQVKRLSELLSKEFIHSVDDFLKDHEDSPRRRFHFASDMICCDSKYSNENMDFGLYYHPVKEIWVLIFERPEEEQIKEKAINMASNKKDKGANVKRFFYYSVANKNFQVIPKDSLKDNPLQQSRRYDTKTDSSDDEVLLLSKSKKKENSSVSLIELDSVFLYISRLVVLEKYKTEVYGPLFSRLYGPLKLQGRENEVLEPAQYCDYVENPGEILNLNEDQKKVVKEIKDNLAVVHGPPGTGKSTTIVNFIKKRIPQENRVLIVTTTNKAIDSLTNKIEKNQEGEKILALGRNVEEASKKFTLESQLLSNPVIKKISQIFALVEQIETRILKRNKIGYLFLDINDILYDIEDVSTDYSSSLEILFDLIYDFIKVKEEKRKKEIFVKHSKALKKELDDVFHHAFEKEVSRIWQKTRYFVCTASTSVKLKYRLSNMDVTSLKKKVDLLKDDPDFHIQHLIVDEAGSVHPLDLLGSLLTKSQTVLMVGDPKQLPPLVHQKIKNPIYSTSVMEQLIKKSNFPMDTFYLNIQYRMPREVCKIVSDLFYDGKLVTDSSKLPTTNPVKCILIRDGEEKELNLSKINHVEISETLKQLKDLKNRGAKNEDICIITFYSAQRKRLQEIVNENETLQGVKIKTVDSMQGREEKHVILSFVRTKSIGFLKDQKRINVSISRCTESLTIISSPKLKFDRTLRTLFEMAHQ